MRATCQVRRPERESPKLSSSSTVQPVRGTSALLRRRYHSAQDLLHISPAGDCSQSIPMGYLQSLVLVAPLLAVGECCFWKLPASCHPILSAAPLHLGHGLLKDRKIALVPRLPTTPRSVTLSLSQSRVPQCPHSRCPPLLCNANPPLSARKSELQNSCIIRHVMLFPSTLPWLACHLASYAIFLAAESARGPDR